MGTNSVAICNLFIGSMLLQDSVMYFGIIMVNIKQLLDEVEHDIMNYQNLVSVSSASAFGFGR